MTSNNDVGFDRSKPTYTFTVEVNIDELTTAYLEALEIDKPDSLDLMIEHEYHWLEGSGRYVKEIEARTS